MGIKNDIPQYNRLAMYAVAFIGGQGKKFEDLSNADCFGTLEEASINYYLSRLKLSTVKKSRAFIMFKHRKEMTIWYKKGGTISVSG